MPEPSSIARECILDIRQWIERLIRNEDEAVVLDVFIDKLQAEVEALRAWRNKISAKASRPEPECDDRPAIFGLSQIESSDIVTLSDIGITPGAFISDMFITSLMNSGEPGFMDWLDSPIVPDITDSAGLDAISDTLSDLDFGG